MATHSSILAWRIPGTGEPDELPSMGSYRVKHMEKEMATHSSVLAWRIPGTGEPDELPSVGSHRVGQAPGVGNGQGSLACCCPWGHKESDMTDAT